MGAKLDLGLAVLNGLVGDHLVRTRNGLAIELGLVHGDAPLALTRARLADAIPAPTPDVVVLVHGLMCTETIFRFPDGADYGSMLARDFGVTPLRVRYNSGRPIADNGAALSALLEGLVDAYPVPIASISLIGFSMGGLVTRAACHTSSLAGCGHLAKLRRAFYVGTPHRGAPLERGGRVLASVLRKIPDPYTRLAADLIDLRSDGVRDLGDADLRHEDRDVTRARARFSLRDPRHPIPLLDGIEHFLVAGNLSADPRLALWFGDALVPVPSATFDHCSDAALIALPPDHVRVFPGFAHVRLAHDPQVYEVLRGWWAGPSAETAARSAT